MKYIILTGCFIFYDNDIIKIIKLDGFKLFESIVDASIFGEQYLNNNGDSYKIIKID